MIRQARALLRIITIGIATVSGAVVGARTVCGPIARPVRIGAPVNAGGLLGLAWAGIVAQRSGEQAPASRGGCGWRDLAASAPVAAITAAAFERAHALYFLSDDFPLVTAANRQPLLARASFATAGGDGFFRPIGNLSLAVTAQWAHADPQRWHAAAIGLHMLNALLVFLLTRRLGASRLACFFAAALFAIHGARPEAAVWIAGRYDLLATAFVLAGMLLFIRSCEITSASGYVYELAAVAAMVAALLTKESAYVFPALLVLYGRTVRGAVPPGRAALVRFGAAAAMVFAYRCWLVGGIGGYLDRATGRPLVLLFGWGTLKALLLRIWMGLFFPINWSLEPQAWLGVLLLAYLGALAWLAMGHPDRRRVVFGLGFTLIAVLPPLHLLVIGSNLYNSRLLYLPSVGFAILLAAAADGLNGRARWAVVALVLAFHAGALRHNLDLWEEASNRARAAARVAANCLPAESLRLTGVGVPGHLAGVPFFANVFTESIAYVEGARATGGGALRWDPARGRLDCRAGN